MNELIVDRYIVIEAATRAALAGVPRELANPYLANTGAAIVFDVHYAYVQRDVQLIVQD